MRVTFRFLHHDDNPNKFTNSILPDIASGDILKANKKWGSGIEET